MKDFTHKIYKELIEEFIKQNYNFIRVDEFFNDNFDKTNKIILMRHDVDRYPNRSLAMAKLESKLGIKSTYYFRTIPQTFKKDIIKQIASLGHEIAYHYESLAECSGNYKEAIKDFENNLSRLRRIYPIKNIAMHGRPTSKFDSRDLWKRYDYKKYGILSEPYFDIDFNEVFYATDAGRAWGDDKINLRDKVDSSFSFRFSHTQELINLIKEDKLPKRVMINIHPEHWAQSSFEWLQILLIRRVKNFVKKIVIKR